MCGRFTLTATADELRQLFDLADSPVLAKLAPRYNIAPTQPVVVVREHPKSGARTLDVMRWGLIPSWSKEPGTGAPLINARAETVADKPAFRSAFKRRRCLVPASGFYEWQAKDGHKQPYYVHVAGGVPFAMAGLWETWHGPDGDEIDSCTIITTAANPLVRPLHERMAVILPPAAYGDWLDPTIEDPHLLQSLLEPFPAKQMDAYPVSTYVNAARNEGPECLARVEVAGG